MTVAEFREYLLQFDQELEVNVETYACGNTDFTDISELEIYSTHTSLIIDASVN